MTQEPGSWKVIRVDGSIEEKTGKPTLDLIHAAIGCHTIDCITLDHETMTLMAVDDEGLIDGRPINPKASVLYQEVCIPEARSQAVIAGDVAIINDEDFG